ncbi:hypothetical protein [Enterococcus olivae]
MIRFALASLRYHKRSTVLYTLLLVIGFSLLLFLNSLLESLPLLFNQTKELITSSGYQEEESFILQQLRQSQEQLRLVYTYIRDLRLPLLLAFFFVFFLFGQIKKDQELLAWYQSGSSVYAWMRFNLAEHLSPILLLAIVFSMVFLIFQHSLGNLVLETHLKAMDSLNELSVNIQVMEDDSLNRLLIRFPRTNQALFSSLQLSSHEWFRMFFSSLWKTLVTLGGLLGSMSLCISGSYSYWRYHQWKNQSL